MGRHTNVIYTNSWKKDSARRDFTFNALYVEIIINYMIIIMANQI